MSNDGGEDNRLRLFVNIKGSWAFIAVNKRYEGNSMEVETWRDATVTDGDTYSFMRACYTLPEARVMLRGHGIMRGPDLYRLVKNGNTIATAWIFSIGEGLEVCDIAGRYRHLPDAATLDDVRVAFAELVGLVKVSMKGVGGDASEFLDFRLQPPSW